MMVEKYNPLQLREVFHLEFLRWLGRKIDMSHYALKGGANLRFFYGSVRYSEDMDLNARVIRVDTLQDKVMQILKSASFQNSLKPFGIKEIVPPEILKSKQTQTTQRFKIHLITSRNEDFFTKVEFSRREFKNHIKIESVPDIILREYKLAPLLVSHYDIASAISQKLKALANRKIIQARDAFDLYLLSSQIGLADKEKIKADSLTAKKARENILEIGFEQFRDTVVSYLLEEDRKIYDSLRVWDEIRLKVIDFIGELKAL